MKKQKPAKKRGNPAKQRQKCAAGSARGKHVDPLTSLARTAGPNSAPKAKSGRKGASAEPARLGLPAVPMPAKPRAQAKATAHALPQSYLWEDREAFAIVCAPFLILALWFTYQQTMRPVLAPLPEIAVHRDSGTAPPVVAVAPNLQPPPPSPSAKPVEPAPAVTDPAPAPIASAAPVFTQAKPSSLPPASETEPAARTIAPAPEAPATLPPLATIAPPAPPETAPLVEVERAPATVAPPAALEAPRTAAPAEPLPPLASIARERPAPAAPAEVPAAPVLHVEAAAPAPAATPPAPERQQHAALAPIARPGTPPPAPAIAPAPPAIAPPVEAPISPAMSPQMPSLVPAPVLPQAAPAPSQAAPTATQAFEVCRAPTALFAPTQSASPIAPPPAPDFGLALARAARHQLTSLVIYNAKYARIGFPNGDVAPLFGVCTDVVVRAYRMLGIDLQQLIAETRTGRGDRNIDHRRVEVVRRFLALHGETLAITDFAEDYQPGDIVTYYRPQNRTSTQHIAIVSDIAAPSGRYMIVHNRGWGPQLEDALFVDKITGHFRFSGMKRQPESPPVAASVVASTAPWTLITSTLAKRDMAAKQPQLADVAPVAASSAASAEALVARSSGQSKPVIASLGPERASFCRPGDMISGSTRAAEARAPASPTPAAAKPAAAAAKPTNPATAKPAAPPAAKPAQAKAQPKSLQKAATGSAPRPASL